MFGTDCPLQGPMQMRFAREIIEHLEIPAEDKAGILGGNAAKLLAACQLGDGLAVP